MQYLMHATTQYALYAPRRVQYARHTIEIYINARQNTRVDSRPRTTRQDLHNNNLGVRSIRTCL